MPTEMHTTIVLVLVLLLCMFHKPAIAQESRFAYNLQEFMWICSWPPIHLFPKLGIWMQHLSINVMTPQYSPSTPLCNKNSVTQLQKMIVKFVACLYISMVRLFVMLHIKIRQDGEQLVLIMPILTTSCSQGMQDDAHKYMCFHANKTATKMLSCYLIMPKTPKRRTWAGDSPKQL